VNFTLKRGIQYPEPVPEAISRPKLHLFRLFSQLIMGEFTQSISGIPRLQSSLEIVEKRRRDLISG